MTQQQLARASGITQATVSRIEKDLIQGGAETFQRLAFALGVTLDYLMNNEKEMIPDELLRVDPNMQRIYKSYMVISASRRKMLEEFACFLEEQERRENLRMEMDS